MHPDFPLSWKPFVVFAAQQTCACKTLLMHRRPCGIHAHGLLNPTLKSRALQVWQAVLTKPIDLDSPRMRQQMSDGARSLLKVHPHLPIAFVRRHPQKF